MDSKETNIEDGNTQQPENTTQADNKTPQSSSNQAPEEASLESAQQPEETTPSPEPAADTPPSDDEPSTQSSESPESTSYDTQAKDTTPDTEEANTESPSDQNTVTTDESVEKEEANTDSPADQNTVTTDESVEKEEANTDSPSNQNTVTTDESVEKEEANKEVHATEATQSKTQDNSELESLLTEEEKKWVAINADNQLMLRGTSYTKERKIADLNPTTAESVLNKLREQYQKVTEEFDKLKTKFELQGDQVVLYPDILHMLNYLNTVQALGSLAPYVEALTDMSSKSKQALEQLKLKYNNILDRFRDFLKHEIDSIRQSDSKVKELHQEWKDTPALPNKEHHTLYEQLKELQEQYTLKRRERQRKDDLLQLNNLDRKKELVQKAQEIAATDHWKEGHSQMQALFKEWKSIGRVPLDQKDRIWEEFRTAKNTFYDRRKEFYTQFIGELEENLAKKEKVVAEIESLQHSTDWSKTTKRIEELDKEFDEIGQIPREKWKSLLDRLHTAKRTFFGNRNKHYEDQRKDFDKNLITKTDLANRVDALKDSTDWRGTTRKMNELFDQWKAAGSTFRKKENEVWEKFITARKHFFNRKDEYFGELNKKKHKENILRLDQEKAKIENLARDNKLDLETLDQLKKDYDKEENDRFKSKIKETLDVLEKKIEDNKSQIAEKKNWVAKTEKEIQKLEKSETQAEKEKTEETKTENRLTPEVKNSSSEEEE